MTLQDFVYFRSARGICESPRRPSLTASSPFPIICPSQALNTDQVAPKGRCSDQRMPRIHQEIMELPASLGDQVCSRVVEDDLIEGECSGIEEELRV